MTSNKKDDLIKEEQLKLTLKRSEEKLGRTLTEVERKILEGAYNLISEIKDLADEIGNYLTEFGVDSDTEDGPIRNESCRMAAGVGIVLTTTLDSLSVPSAFDAFVHISRAVSEGLGRPRYNGPSTD